MDNLGGYLGDKCIVQVDILITGYHKDKILFKCFFGEVKRLNQVSEHGATSTSRIKPTAVDETRN